jgi:hypothetical protein
MLTGGNGIKRVRWESPATRRRTIHNASQVMQLLAAIAGIYSAFGPALVAATRHG